MRIAIRAGVSPGQPDLRLLLEMHFTCAVFITCVVVLASDQVTTFGDLLIHPLPQRHAAGEVQKRSGNPEPPGTRAQIANRFGTAVFRAVLS